MAALRTPRIAVVGAGIAGLVAALELSRRGLAVTLLERAATPGGKMRQVIVRGVAMDAGPTVLTLRPLFERILDAAGTSLQACGVHLRPLEVLARHAWSADERLDLFASTERTADAIGRFGGAHEARRYLDFCATARSVYGLLEPGFLLQPRPSLQGLLRATGVARAARLLQLRPFTSLWRALGGHFRDPRLRQLYGRYATYCGSSPFSAPATLMLVAHVEQMGVWEIEGGMHRLAQALLRLLRSRGVDVRLSSPVRRIVTAHGRVSGLDLPLGERLDVDAVVVTSDAAALAAGLFGAEVAAAAAPVPEQRRSLSAVTWNILGTPSGFDLSRHNVFFSRDYQTEFDDLFLHRRLPAEPTVYVCAQDRGGGSGAPSPTGPERLFCLMNAPAVGDRYRYRHDEESACLTHTLTTLRRCGLDLPATPEQATITTPTDFDRLFPGSGGALYGQASHGWRASFTRPGARSPVPGLYLAGGSTHPGPGLPMAALSACHAADCVMLDLASGSR